MNFPLENKCAAKSKLWVTPLKPGHQKQNMSYGRTAEMRRGSFAAEMDCHRAAWPVGADGGGKHSKRVSAGLGGCQGRAGRRRAGELQVSQVGFQMSGLGKRTRTCATSTCVHTSVGSLSPTTYAHTCVLNTAANAHLQSSPCGHKPPCSSLPGPVAFSSPSLCMAAPRGCDRVC